MPTFRKLSSTSSTIRFGVWPANSGLPVDTPRIRPRSASPNQILFRLNVGRGTMFKQDELGATLRPLRRWLLGPCTQGYDRRHVELSRRGAVLNSQASYRLFTGWIGNGISGGKRRQ